MLAQGGTGNQKSQARATIFLVLFLLLVPTALAISYTGGITADSITGDSTASITTLTGAADASPQQDAVPESTEPTGQAEQQADTSENSRVLGIPDTPPESQDQVQPEETEQTEPTEPEEPEQAEQPEEPIEEVPEDEEPASKETENTKPEQGQPEQEEPGPEPAPEPGPQPQPYEEPEFEPGPETEPEPETPGNNGTEPEANQTNQIPDAPETPNANETGPETPETNETNETGQGPIVPEPTEPCNITCGDCETLILDESNCKCVSVEGCDPTEVPEVPELPEMPEQPEEPAFRISVESPARVTRGAAKEFSATIENTGNGTAFGVSPYWVLPEGLQLIATDHDCSTLLPGSFCKITGHIYVQPEAIGRKEIRIMVDYE